mgnify:CR=1 FL=1
MQKWETLDFKLEIRKMKKAIVRLKGGIGNQLFQLSFSLYIKKFFPDGVFFDLDHFLSDFYHRSPILKDLFLDFKVKSLKEIENYFYAKEEEIKSFSQINNTHDAEWIFFDGYWQNLEYVLIDEIKEKMVIYAKSKLADFNAWPKIFSNSIAVHVRRHDYKHHGLCDENFYTDSVKWLKSKYYFDNVYLFSDEPNYAVHFFRKSGIDPKIINTKNDLLDLYIMSICGAHVISNSTFSWWGAALAKSRYVIYPDPWSFMHKTSSNFFPIHWIKVNDSVFFNESQKNYFEKINESKFDRDLKLFLAKKNDNEEIFILPYLGEDTPSTFYDAHYIYHTAWAARWLYKHPASIHIDIGSDIKFVSIVSTYQKIIFFDYRPVNLKLSNLECNQADLLSLNFPDRSIISISCMHVVEHIGLGRYGDEINANGSFLAMKELQRILAPGGYLFFVVPVGIPRIFFNAHRVFNPKDILEFFSELTLKDFSFVDDQGCYHENCNPEQAKNLNYGCGCFLFLRSVD